MKARTRGLPLAGTAIIGVRWHLLVCLLLGSIGLFWILAGIIRPLGNAIRKRACW